MKNGERDSALENLALSETRVSEKQQKIQKLEEEVVRLRRALEQSMTRLNSLSSDSDHHVDRFSSPLSLSSGLLSQRRVDCRFRNGPS